MTAAQLAELKEFLSGPQEHVYGCVTLTLPPLNVAKGTILVNNAPKDDDNAGDCEFTEYAPNDYFMQQLEAYGFENITSVELRTDTNYLSIKCTDETGA